MVSQATICPGQPCLAEFQAPIFQGTPGSDKPPCSTLEPIPQPPLSPWSFSSHFSPRIHHLLSGPAPSRGFLDVLPRASALRGISFRNYRETGRAKMDLAT